MCGVAGFWSSESVAEDTAIGWLRDMAGALAHRGPDASGVVFDRDFGIGFAHQRLSVVDLTEGGRQPMWSHSGRYCITYNGEIYNAPEIRSELDARGLGIPWRGHSDTEVALEAIEAMGLEPALRTFRGMFAFGLWDARTKRLFLARDRLGIKPLLFSRGSFGIVFASELQALYPLPAFEPRLDRQSVASFLRYGAVPGDRCIAAGVCKVAPGTYVELSDPSASAVTRVYWSAEQVAAQGLQRPFRGDSREAIDELESRLRRSVALRMRSDVPLGAFLSGGIDSSVVVAMMQKDAPRPAKTFCIGNTLPGYDESAHAAEVARHLGSEHFALIAEPDEMLSIVPDIASRWDEPFADSSQIPTFMVSHLTKQHVTVALSGDGGDELFAGYNRHGWAPRLWKAAHLVPRRLRAGLRALRLVNVDDWDRAFRAVGLGDAIRLPGDKLHKLSALAEVDTPYAFYERLRSCWPDPARVLVDRDTWEPAERGRVTGASLAEQLMFYDMVEYLPDDILVKVDRASMAVSLEARVPLLDHEVVELAWQLPLEWKIRGGRSKWILRRVLERHVPPSLFERPKMGFGVPVGQWLRGPLREWGADLLDAHALAAEGILDSEVVTTTWRAHQAGRGNHEHRLWALLMFQAWWKTNRRFIEAR